MSLDGGRAISTRRPTCGAYAEGTPSRASFGAVCGQLRLAARGAEQGLRHNGWGACAITGRG